MSVCLCIVIIFFVFIGLIQMRLITIEYFNCLTALINLKRSKLGEATQVMAGAVNKGPNYTTCEISSVNMGF